MGSDRPTGGGVIAGCRGSMVRGGVVVRAAASGWSITFGGTGCVVAGAPPA
ncbi:hypothetical protein [Nocardia arthritidis]|uniref:hypothetical protein n=1 Tax=Nocardia arthritidis TaxID=228602 RepID=UPI0012ED55A5|nr:hypothetical protein [Nocardia arthritidis]